MFSYIPARERRANTLYRIYLALTRTTKDEIATALLIAGFHRAVNVYGIVAVRAVRHYHPALKKRPINE